MTEQPAQTILDVLDSDHRAMLDLLDRAAAETDPDALAAWCEQLVVDVVRHFVAEEQYLLPLVRERFGDASEHLHTAFVEHREIEDALRRLENVDRDPKAVHPLLADVGARLSRHIAGQDAVFDQLRARADPAELVQLAEEVRGSEQLAPTRPRIYRPESAAVNKVVSVVQGFVDHVRDSYEHRGEDPSAP